MNLENGKCETKDNNMLNKYTNKIINIQQNTINLVVKDSIIRVKMQEKI